MGRYGRDQDDLQLEIAYAVGTGEDILEHLREQHRREGWVP